MRFAPLSAFLALVVLALTVAGCEERPRLRADAGVDQGDTSFTPIDAMMPMEMEMEMEPLEPVDAGPVVPTDVGPTLNDSGVELPDAFFVPVDSGPIAGSCTHSFGGVYSSGACSTSYQCVDGQWVMRTAGTSCSCVEPTGMVGCLGAVADSGTQLRDSGTQLRDAGPLGTDAGRLMPPTRTSSESIGTPGTGRLERSMRSMMNSSFVLANTGRNAYFGTEETIFWLAAGFDQVQAWNPNAMLPQLRDIALQNGGVPANGGAWPHSSHRSGRDADATYYLNSCPATGCPLGDVALADFDAAATMTLFEVWLRSGVAMYIFVDHDLQQPLYEEARRRGATSAELTAWFQYPRATTVREGVIRHVANHRNHFHVRFQCPADDSRCVP